MRHVHASLIAALLLAPLAACAGGDEEGTTAAGETAADLPYPYTQEMEEALAPAAETPELGALAEGATRNAEGHGAVEDAVQAQLPAQNAAAIAAAVTPSAAVVEALGYDPFDPATPACENALAEHDLAGDAELLARCRALPAATQRCMMAPYRAQSGPECNAALEALDTPTRDRLSALLVDRPE
ncbi:MAG TPA: hypothetical protein RMH85_18280 [Polyangiaceae bacterium LLY-WYZ-15_(1-7)]|nr:hypothetical protein [Myxococcales bacterium]MAT24265.1 hypothetical protein [Sandaracinus sp.]HJK89306.1 hypothetical protein [Polyangiaceae bacterium LLY-WYZ-15_(1-7)]MBJ74222.1 hypothetical protein [Sandaracinus sp.]HJL04235.1 hypothetical protein [Polyangiaceae bacterium LLY-WYZ-15_(1-7)]